MFSRRKSLVVAVVIAALGTLATVYGQNPTDLRSLAKELRDSLRQMDRRLGRLEQLADQISRRTGQSGADAQALSPTPEDVVAAQKAYQRGRSEAAQQNHEAAIAAFTEAVTLDPGHDSAFLYRGKEQFQVGRLDLALADVNESLSIQPQNAKAYTLRARVWRRLGEPIRAASDLDESLSRDPTNAEALSLRAEIAIEEGDFQSALADYELALQAQPASAELHLGHARVLREANRLQEALAECNAAISLAPSSAEAYACRAEVHLRQGETALALEDLNTVYRLDPDLPAATRLVSSIRKLDELETLANAVTPEIRRESNPPISTPSQHQTEPRLEPAQSASAEPTAARPETPASSATRPVSGTELAEAGTGGAERRAPTGIREPAGAAGATNSPAEMARQQTKLGREYTDQGRYQEAIEALNKAITLDPASALAYNSRGYARLRARKLDNAIHDFSEAIQLNPDYANAYWNRAVARKLNGDPAGSEDDRRKAADLGWVNTGISVISMNRR